MVISVSNGLWTLLFGSSAAVGDIVVFIAVLVLTHLRTRSKLPPSIPDSDG